MQYQILDIYGNFKGTSWATWLEVLRVYFTPNQQN